jgi:tetratricopeptide (TPR) repeat protein
MPSGVVALTPAASPPEAGDRVHLIGNPGAAPFLWVLTPGEVRQTGRLTDRAVMALIGQIVMTDLSSNPGDSGGPVVNDAGQVVGIHRGAARGQQLAIEIDVRELVALADKEKALLHPQTADDHVRRGHWFRTQRQWDWSLAAFGEALRTDPKSVKALEERAWVLNEVRRYGDAVVDCDRLLGLDRDNVEAYRERGYARLQQGRLEDATRDLSAALQRKTEDRSALGYRLEAYERLRDYPRALVDATRLLELDSRNVRALTARGEAYLELALYRLAINDLDQVLAQDPRNLAALSARGYAYWKLKDPKRALEDLDRAVTIAPDNATARERRSQVRDAMGDRAGARADLSWARSLRVAG